MNTVVTSSDSGLSLFNDDGEGLVTDCNLKIKEPRYWLKDLPDADLFIEGVLSIHFDAAQRWAVTYFDGHSHWLPYAGLPMLDDENIAISLISIDDLRVWQKENK